MARLSRDDYGIALTSVVRLRAACTRRQVGAVILDAAGRIAGTGYNGVPAGEIHCDEGGCPRGLYRHDEIPKGLGNSGHSVICKANHAEANAIAWAIEHGADIETCTLYVSEQPCAECRVLIRVSRIARTVTPGGVVFSTWTDRTEGRLQ